MTGEVLDIMEFRMGGTFLQELRDLRANGASLADVVQYFLTKDAEMRKYTRRKARLEAQAKVKSFILSFKPIKYLRWTLGLI